MTKKYGKTREDVKAEKSIQCRQIISEINKFGIDESQRIQLIKLLAMEMENHLNMKKIVNTLNEIVENTIDNEKKGLIGI